MEALLNSLDTDPRRRGRQFEEVCRWYLLTEPYYATQLSQVWLVDDWPERYGDDAGVDLVAETKDGELWAIQAKAYDPAYWIKKADVDSFLSESARPEFSHRLLIATTDRLGRLARRTIQAQEKPVSCRLRSDLEQASIDWSAAISDLKPAKPPQPATPRPHQEEALAATLEGLKEADRGQIIMACGTGKTLVALWLSERLEARRTLVLVPSLSLLKQTIEEWLINAATKPLILPVCSDDKVRGSDQMVTHVEELGFPATVDPRVIGEFLERPGLRVVFSTYQSSPAVAEALRESQIGFDLAIADEAHRCAGRVSSNFGTILDPDLIRSRKRVFMTATPKTFTARVRTAGADADFEIASMDDDAKFGREFYRLSFSDAMRHDPPLLSDYRVLVIGVDDATYQHYAESGRFVTTDGEEVTDARSLAGQIGLAKAIKRYGLQRTITFHGRIKAARTFAESLPSVVAWMPQSEAPSHRVWADHVSGKMNAAERAHRLRRLAGVDESEAGVLSNARCLTEGVNVPTLDGVAFIDPKRSKIDIVQAVGRAIRKAESKDKGTIVIPIFIGPADDPQVELAGSAFKHVWDVLLALRSHDDELGQALDELRTELGRRPSALPRLPEKITIDLPTKVGDAFARAFTAKLVESTTASWEFWYGLVSRFADREGHSRVTQGHREDGFQLGTWVSNQRTAQQRGQLLSERVRRLETLPRWVWDANEAGWEDGFAALLRFVEREQHARVPGPHEEEGLRLGNWVEVQRTFHRRRQLDGDRTRRLETIPEWIWDPNQADWDRGFSLLTRFVEREGHARVPSPYKEEGFALGAWVNSQRSRRGRLPPERIRGLERIKGWVWQPRRHQWNEGFYSLARFVEREGHARVPHQHKEEGFALGAWVGRQRTAHRGGKLEAETARRLEALQGWTWEPFTEDWEEGFAAVVCFVEREGHARVPDRHREAGLELGAWVGRQRQAHRLGRLGPTRLRRLGALPDWTWDTDEAAWEEGFAALECFVEREGHARVPKLHKEDGFRLGAWVGKQRGKRSRLDSKLIRRLEVVLGWTWDSNEAAWEDSFAALLRFVEREGHARVPKTHKETGLNLGNWVAVQREAHRKGQLLAPRVQRLVEVPGWAWNPIRDDWERGFAALLRFIEREGHAFVPSRHEEDGFKLGNWVTGRRNRKHRMTLEQIRRLDVLPEWIWDVSTAQWEQAFAALVRFTEREGHAIVPKTHEEDGLKLGNWIGTQRTTHRSGKLENDGVRRLEAVRGWSWDPFRDAWEKGFSWLTRFVEREGQARVPWDHAEGGFKLGRWVAKQRSQKGKLDPERIRRLEAVRGWAWRIKKRPRKKPLSK